MPPSGTIVLGFFVRDLKLLLFIHNSLQVLSSACTETQVFDFSAKKLARKHPFLPRLKQDSGKVRGVVRILIGRYITNPDYSSAAFPKI